ncbi:MAG TPA: TerC/Alx family metal homeostasis membrane protein [Candidatus Kapabacteria bacterium]|jgi:tellurite resistance protein TerC
MNYQRALAWSIFWIGLSMLVAICIARIWGTAPAEAFLTGYALEKALSIDNLFVFLMLFTHFGVERHAQRRALNYGVIGVIILRGLMIFGGIALIDTFQWVLYIFGAVVIYTGFVMAFGKEKGFDPERSRTVKIVRRFVRISEEYHGTRFFIREGAVRVATPLFLVVCVIELMDIVFAVDSIPAIFAVTRNPWIVFSSNMLAVLGLRALYFLLERAREAFRFVKQGVGIILWFIGVKMLLPAFWPDAVIGNATALSVVVAILMLSILLSVTVKEKNSDA